jgi:tagatose-1,6-bisphosphate aldolase non-catalytic subunit AgaZ/GatZ
MPLLQAVTAAQGAVTATSGQEQPAQESRKSAKLSMLEIRAVMNSVVLAEGPMWDKIKGKAQQIGTNLTTKVTADKLNKAWAAAGSPMDSDAIMQIIVSAGVPQEIVQQTFSELNIGAADQATQAAEPAKLTVKQINQIIPTLRMRDLLSLQKTVDARLNKGAA